LTEVDVATPVMEHLAEENITVTVEKRKTTHDLGASDSEVTQKTTVMIPVKYRYQN
jgi:hypothetical protein